MSIGEDLADMQRTSQGTTRMRPSLYLETTVPSYYVARPSTDMVILTHQHMTQEWWNTQLGDYEAFVSEVVYDEIRRGDADASRRRLEVIKGFPTLDVTDEAADLAQIYLEELPLPRKALADALHLAVASMNGMDYLLTWNCRHIARGSVKRLLPSVNAARGLSSPTICTPEELMYEDQDLD